MTIFSKINNLIEGCNEINIQESRWKVDYYFDASARLFSLTFNRQYRGKCKSRYVDSRLLFMNNITDEEFEEAEQFLANIMVKVINEVKNGRKGVAGYHSRGAVG